MTTAAAVATPPPVCALPSIAGETSSPCGDAGPCDDGPVLHGLLFSDDDASLPVITSWLLAYRQSTNLVMKNLPIANSNCYTIPSINGIPSNIRKHLIGPTPSNKAKKGEEDFKLCNPVTFPFSFDNELEILQE